MNSIADGIRARRTLAVPVQYTSCKALFRLGAPSTTILMGRSF